MNMNAIKAVLEALRGKCYDDMADEKSDPEEKIADAMSEAKGMGDAEEDEDDMGFDPEEEKLAEAADEELEPDEDDPEAKLHQFFKPKKPRPTSPGTAVMIALENKRPPGAKKSMKDLMHG